MGNCNQCLRAEDQKQGQSAKRKDKKKQKKPNLGDPVITESDNSSVDLTSMSLIASRDKKQLKEGAKLCKYTRITYEDAFPETGGEELQYVLSQLDQDQVLTFQVHLKSFKLQQFNGVNQEMYLTTELGEDLVEKRNRLGLSKKRNIRKGGPESEINPESIAPGQGGILEDATLSQNIDVTRGEGNHTRWESEHFRLGLEGSVEYTESDNHVKFEVECADIRRQFLVIQIFLASQPRKPIAYLSVEFLALALGPKKCDLEIRDMKTLKPMGKIQFEVDVRQYQTMGICIEELHCGVNGKEDRALFSQFKVITNNDVPRVSDPTQTLIGRFKKDKNLTQFKWKRNPDDLFNQHPLPEVHYDIAMETLKNSTIHMLLRVDAQFSEHQTEKVLQKIKMRDQRGKTTKQVGKRTDADVMLMMMSSDDHPGAVVVDSTQLVESSRSLSKMPNKTNSSQFVKGDEMSINSNHMSFHNAINDVTVQNDHEMVVQEEQERLIPNIRSATQESSGKIIQGKSSNNTNPPIYRRQTSSRISSSPETSMRATNSKSKRLSSVAAEIKMGLSDFFRKKTHNERKKSHMSSRDMHESAEFSRKMKGLLVEEHQQHEAFFEELKKEETRNSLHSNRTSVQIDAADYYRKYDAQDDNTQQHLGFNVVGECYLNFSKLLQSEMRKLEKRDSSILSQKMSLSIKKSNSQVRSTSKSAYKLSIKINPKNEDGELRIERKSFSEQLWHVGKVVGTVKGVFALQNIPTVQQMQLGILTESGVVLNSAPILLRDDKDGGFLGILKKNNRNENITQLIEFTKKLKKIDSYKDKKQIYRTFNEKERIINDIISILADGDSDLAAHGNPRMFKYSNELDMIRAQQAFIELGFHCLMFADVTRYEFRRDYYEMLSQVFLRDELKLNNVALLPEEMEGNYNARKSIDFNLMDSHIESSRDNTVVKSAKSSMRRNTHLKNSEVSKKVDLSPHRKMLLPPESAGAKAQQPEIKQEDPEDIQFERVKQEKVKIAQYYQKLLCQILDDCLIKFCRKDVEPFLRSYLEICISIGFFRVPRFQSIFLDCVNSQQNGSNLDQTRGHQVIPEWRNMNWEIDEESGVSVSGGAESGLVKLFDWNVHFYSHIPVSDEYTESMKFMRRIENNKKWQARVKKRSIAYFQIIRRWADYIKTTVQTNNLFWQDIPGYRVIVKSILLELKHRPITDYPDSLIETTLELIQNPDLLTVMMTVVFQKTNAYDSATLCTTMGLITKWMNHIEKQGLPFPSNFDFSFFFKGITVALEMDHSLSTPRTLNLLYRTLHYFPIEQRSVIVQEIFKRFFYQLFFNWAYNVRDIFIAFLLYQIEYLYIFRTTSYLTVALESQQPQMLPRQNSKRASQSPFGRNNAYQMLSIRSQVMGGGAGQDSSQGIQGGGQMNLDMLKLKRKDNFKKFASVIEKIEQQLQQNPNEAEESFDRSVSMKRFRVTSEMVQYGNRSMKTSPMSRGGGILPKQAKDEFPGPSKLSAQAQDKKRLQNQSFTVTHFIKSHDFYKRFVEDVETLEEYYKMQSGASVTTHNLIATQGQNAQDTQSLTANSATTQDLEKRYRKIMARIPKNLHIYVPSALDDFNRQLEEYELWRSQAVSSGAQRAIFKAAGLMAGSEFAILNILPEFNMEKNMPVEDDDNLEKKEEW